MSSILQDLRYAARRLVRDRRFTFAAVAALALGIGATSAVFTLVNAVLLRSLPFDEPDRIMWLGTRDAQGREFGVSEPDFEDWRRATRTFSGHFARCRWAPSTSAPTIARPTSTTPSIFPGTASRSSAPSPPSDADSLPRTIARALRPWCC